jgi:hypothetical protein
MQILRGVGSRMLPCGCLVGLYEAYDTKTVALIDARGSGCLDAAHRVDAAVTIDMVSALRHPRLGGSRPGEPAA